MKNFRTLALITTLFGMGAMATPNNLTNAELPRGLQDVRSYCATSNLESLACPNIGQFSFQNPNTLSEDLRETLGLNIKFASPSQASKLIQGSMKGQLQNAWENAAESKRIIGRLEDVSPNFSASADAFGKYISNASNRGEESAIDPNTYWAPSVNARAVVLINYRSKTVTVIMHGDTDG